MFKAGSKSSHEGITSTGSSMSRDFLIDAMIGATLFSSVVVVYWQVRQFDWIAYDDPDTIFVNQHTLSGLSWHTFHWAFEWYSGAMWQPLTMLSFLLDIRMYGPDPGPMHLENVLLHALSSAGWYVLLKGMTRQRVAAFFTAAFFAMHPAHIESIAWITERKDALSMLMLVASLIAYWRYTLSSGWAAYVLSVFFGALALLSKPMTVTLPILMFLMDLWPLGRTRWWRDANGSGTKPAVGVGRLILEKLPFGLLCFGACIVTLLSQANAGAISPLAGHSLSERFNTAVLGYIRYLGTAFWPAKLSIFYPYQSDIPAAAVFVCVVLLVLITVGAARFYKTRPYLIVGWSWYVVTLVPVIGIVQVGSQSMADRYTYLPFVGLSIAVVWGIAHLVNRRRMAQMLAIVAGLAALAGVTMVTRTYLPCWRNTLTLFNAAALAYPANATIEFQIGEGYRLQKRPDLAIEHYDRSIKLNSNQFSPHNNLANLLLPYFPEMALLHYKEAVRIRPDSYTAHYNYALCLEQLKQKDAAKVEFDRASQLKRN